MRFECHIVRIKTNSSVRQPHVRVCMMGIVKVNAAQQTHCVTCALELIEMGKQQLSTANQTFIVFDVRILQPKMMMAGK